MDLTKEKERLENFSLRTTKETKRDKTFVAARYISSLVETRNEIIYNRNSSVTIKDDFNIARENFVHTEINNIGRIPFPDLRGRTYYLCGYIVEAMNSDMTIHLEFRCREIIDEEHRRQFSYMGNKFSL